MKQLGWVLSAWILASCGFPRPPKVQDDAGDGPGSTECMLAAIGPSIANTNDTITIEGTFDDTVTVNFPGGTSVAATLLGPHRATVRVPASATQGDLTITTCGATLGALPFRRASFVLGVGTFSSNLEQTTGARQYPNLAVPRASHTSAIIGDYLYALGGVARTGALNSVERSLVNADGTLGRFTVVPGVTLVTPRQAHTTVVVHDQVYVVGGFGNGSLNSVEHATIGPHGSLGPFTTSANVNLVTARQGHTSVIIGDYIYVIGGLAASLLTSVERAIIHGDGSLGPFATVPGVKLATARQGHATVVTGTYVYVIGGAGSAGTLQDVERATINADGSLGAFVAVTGAGLTTGRSGHVAAVVGSNVYVFGGVGGSGSQKTVERAAIGPDGSLGAFELVAGLAMRAQRHDHTMTAVGNYLYVLGGSDDIGVLDHGERATLNASAGLEPFAIVPGITLTSPRAHCAGVVLGNFFYVIGGAVDPTGVERSSINADGSLGPFAPVAGVAMAHPRDGHTTAVIGSYLYVLGGDNSVERSAVGADGSLGPFETTTTPTMSSRLGPSSAVVGGYLYVIGGTSEPNSAATSVERSVINDDGSLGGFVTVTSNSATARYFPTTSLIGDYAYIFGGSDPVVGGDVVAVDRASTFFNGALGTFETASTVTMSTKGPIAAVVGNAVYAFGYDSVVQRSVIDPSTRELGPFVTVPELSLTPSRFAETSVVIGNHLYIAGGASGRNPLNSVERAELK